MANGNLQHSSFKELPVINAPFYLNEASLTPSMPLTGVMLRFLNGTSRPVTISYAVRRAASMTPPVAPKITAAPVEVAHYRIIMILFKVPEIDACLLDHHRKLACCQNKVNILVTAGSHLRPVGLELLRRRALLIQRQSLRVDLPFLWHRMFWQALRTSAAAICRLRGSEAIRVLVLDEFYPSRRA
jgi:hypothetical protein